jgi:hypothetical protein
MKIFKVNLNPVSIIALQLSESSDKELQSLLITHSPDWPVSPPQPKRFPNALKTK